MMDAEVMDGWVEGTSRKGPRPKGVENRFWKFVNRDTPTGCWEWNGVFNSQGYGRIYVGGKLRLSHRVSYMMRHGFIPKSSLVLHRCDNPKCVNPDHLFLGTVKDNTQDGIRKRRVLVGEKNGQAKLTEAQVLSIREAYARGGCTLADLAEMHGVWPMAISRIVNRLRWRHI